MNDKDKEAFQKWKESHIISVVGLTEEEARKKLQIEMTPEKEWQAACEHKQKEIDELKNVTYWTVEQDGKVTRHISISEIEKLQAENAKLRECVEFYANQAFEGMQPTLRQTPPSVG